MDAGNKNFAIPRQATMKRRFHDEKRRAGGPVPAADDGAVRIPAIQARIDEIKRALGGKTALMRVWGTLADLYALKTTLLSREGDPGKIKDPAIPDDVDESMGEYINGFKEYQSGSMAEAEEHLLASIERLGWNVLARLTLGNLYFMTGEHDKADSALAGALPWCEGEARSEVLTNLGMNALKASRIHDAELYFTRSVEENPSNAYALNDLGLVYEGRGDLEGAMAWYTKAVEADASDEELWYNLGNVLGKAGRKGERLFCFARAVELGFADLREMAEDLVAQGIEPIDPRPGTPGQRTDS